MTTIQSIMTTELITVKPDTHLRDAVKLLIDNGISGLPVVDSSGTIKGVLSEKDLMKAFYDDGTKVSDHMTKKVVSVSVDGELVDVLDILMANSFRRVLIDDNGKLAGLVSRSDLMPVVLDAILERV